MTELRQVKVEDENGNVVGVQYPFSVDGDSVYPKDVHADSSLGDFTGGDFDDLVGTAWNGPVLTNTTSDNPKSITLKFKRGVLTDAFGISTRTGDFSNIKIYALFRQGSEVLLRDDSADSTKVNQVIVDNVGTVKSDGIRIEYHTADTVSISSIVILKGSFTSAIIRGVDPDDVNRDVSVTRDGNLARCGRAEHQAVDRVFSRS